MIKPQRPCPVCCAVLDADDPTLRAHDAALAARDRRIAELEEWQAEARDALIEADKHLASLQQVEAELAQANAEADESQRQRQIDALSATLEGETQRADRAEAERDAAMRELCLADCALEWGCQRDEVNAEMLRDNASAEYGPDVTARLFPEQPVARQAASRRGDRGQDP